MPPRTRCAYRWVDRRRLVRFVTRILHVDAGRDGGVHPRDGGVRLHRQVHILRIGSTMDYPCEVSRQTASDVTARSGSHE